MIETYNEGQISFSVPEDCYNFTFDTLATLMFYETQWQNFSWKDAPEGTVAWAMDADGTAHWFSTSELEVNNTYHDWMKSSDKLPHSLGVAPDFGFERENWILSLRIRDIASKYKITIQVEKE